MEKSIECEKCKKKIISKKSIFKYGYGLGGVIIVIILGIVIHHFWSATGTASISSSVDGVTALQSSIGAKAPDFTLPSTTGNKISLSDYYGKKKCFAILPRRCDV